MSLNAEWLHRINRWREELPRHFYQPLGEISMRGFTTFDQLSLDQALKGSFCPMPTGTSWGAKWEYGWFSGNLELPSAAAGKRIVLQVEVGGEALVFINGKAVGARDNEHREITLSMKGKPGEKYDIAVESYGGHGATPEGGGPVAYGRVSVPEPPPAQRVVGSTTYGIWNEDAYQLWVDVETLFSLRNNLEPGSLRTAEIDKGLRLFTEVVDFEVPPADMNRTFQKSRAMLKPLLDCHNGSTAPVFYAFGHAHLDVAWLWPLQETERKIGRTISNQLALMEEYPQYTYMQSQTHLLMMLKQRYPELYARVKRAVKAGNIIPEGGMWVEADTNLTSGESLIRQFMFGKAFFRQEFGVDSELMWLPDVFGYSGNMPQIMKGCGINYFATAKIFWTYHGADPFPYNLFTWEGIDGSTVLASIIYGYGNENQPGNLIQTWNGRVQKDGISSQIYAFGYGDGGGGPNRNHLEFLRRQANLEGSPCACFASPLAFFKDVEQRGTPTARTVGELYFQNHRGTYTSQARTKRNNRRAELALRDAELWSSAAAVLNGSKYPVEDLHDAWLTVLLLQFHDIIPGSSIHRVYEEAEAMHAEVIQAVQSKTLTAQQKLTARGESVVVFNSLGWARNALVALPEGVISLYDSSGQALLSQEIEGHTYSEINLPSMGWVTLSTKGADRSAKPAKSIKVSNHRLENELMRVEFNRKGEITSLLDKEKNAEFCAGMGNSFRMYKDVPSWFDAWDLDSMYVDLPVNMEGESSVELLAQGALFGALRITRRLNQSILIQTVTLRRNSRMLEFDTRINWQESHKLLKVAFNTNLHADEAVHEIQFGHVRRPTHASRPYDADRFEVSNHKWSALVEENRGFAVLNNAKYGVNVRDGSINLTLLKSALSPDMTADKGEQQVSYAVYIWNGSFIDSELVKKGYELNVPVSLVKGLAGSTSLFSLDAGNIVIETVKLSEDGSGDLILRLYESMRTRTHTVLSTILPVNSAIITNMLETPLEPLPYREGKIELDFKPFEVKTVRLNLQVRSHA
jgi:alpha-mannosidase